MLARPVERGPAIHDIPRIDAKRALRATPLHSDVGRPARRRSDRFHADGAQRACEQAAYVDGIETAPPFRYAGTEFAEAASGVAALPVSTAWPS